MYVVEGEGNLFMEGKDYPLRGGSVAYVPSDCDHQVSNTGDHPFVFICIVPKEGEK
jgi:quercetin dioxygenase-like cupin family protein